MPNDAKVAKNFILPCSSVPVNNDLVLEFDDDGTIQDELWKFVFQESFEDEGLKKKYRAKNLAQEEEEFE